MTNYRLNLWVNYIDNADNDTLDFIFEVTKQEELYEVKAPRIL